MYKLQIMDKRYFELWATIGEIENAYGVNYVTAWSWCRRGEIPRAYDLLTTKFARAQGLRVSAKSLDLWHRQHKQRRVECRKLGIDVSDIDAVPMPDLPFKGAAK
ncbi:hypothetical protein [Thalassovita sp.]|uniref:hypothetical protein n=1 Tax=Thalassovita sp. TaxID=1979401 RepID=UPI002AB296ED|nr:hypothetical protein [Thalassovita sp.]